MTEVGLVVVGIVALFFILIMFGKMKGAPKPETMPLESLMARMQSEERWIAKYKSLPHNNQQGDGIKKQYEDKKLYILELRLEFMKRGLKSQGTDESQTLIPAIQRIIELMKSGMTEEAAKAQASKELEECEQNPN
jgi:uncharacterized protein YoaH (UPF0181 family)